MIILGLETSCDETSAAVVKNGTQILSNVVASSLSLHTQTGGIIPETAAREQVRYITPVIEKALTESLPKMASFQTNLSAPKLFSQIDAIAVTVGPGLISSLLVGVETAKTLSLLWQKPLIPVNHLQAHLYANWLEKEKKGFPSFPLIGLVASGGHTDLVLARNHRKIFWLGGTRDDAAGECFDKTARLLNLPYPGGPAISQLAQKGNFQKIKLPQPMVNQENSDFSFSGLKTAVLNLLNSPTKKPKKADLAASIQETIANVLIKKTLNASQRHKVNSIILGGGVIANNRLREKIVSEIKKLKTKIKLFLPSTSFCTDNAATVGSCAFFNYHPQPWSKVFARPDLAIEEKT